MDRTDATMNTQCPHCRTVFRIGPSQLEARGGKVRCGHCRRIFDARTRLQKELPLEAGEAPPAAGTPYGTRGHGQRQLELDVHGPHHGRVSGVLLSDLAGPEPDSPAAPGRRSLWMWGGINLILLVSLCAQLLFAQRDVFAQDPVLRPILTEMCELADCTLVPRQALDRIELVRRNVYAHPNIEDALILDATFVNNARFAQPYPTLTISLGDLRGETLIRRNFEPGEYRPGMDPSARMTPGSPVRVTLELRDPGPRVRTFEIDFG